MRLNQVTVGETDFETSVAFYCKLGLRLIVSSREEYARFELPDGEATFSVHLQDAVSPNGPVIYFEVDDLDAAVVRLKAEGVALSSEPRISRGYGARPVLSIQQVINFVCSARATIAAIRHGSSVRTAISADSDCFERVVAVRKPFDISSTGSG